MSPRPLPAVAVAVASLLLASCGGGGGGTDDSDGGLDSTSPEDVLESWADAVCETEPVEADDDETDAVLSVECISKQREGPHDATARLWVYDETRFGWQFGDDTYFECDVPWATVTGARWLSELDDGVGLDELTAAGAHVQCEGQ